MALASPSLSLTAVLLHRGSHGGLHPITLSCSPSQRVVSPRKSVGGGKDVASPAVLKWRTRVSFFPALFKKKGKGREELKVELLEAIAPLDRGAEASPDDQQQIDQIASELEAVNPIKEPLKSDLLNGKWELLYTTSRSILQPQRPKFLRPNGKIYQAINTDTLRAQNVETWPYFNQIPIKSPGSGRGELEITYLDEELRVSRGDKGNLFILKMVDPSYRVPV